MDYKSHINNIPNYPKEGINFKDLQPIYRDRTMYSSLIDDMFKRCSPAVIPDYWIGIEARGFILAGALAARFGGGVITVRKLGKLPPPTIDIPYGLEYGTDVLSISKEIQYLGATCIIVDDVYATGGTMNAAKVLCESIGLKVLDTVCAINLGLVVSDVKSVIFYNN